MCLRSFLYGGSSLKVTYEQLKVGTFDKDKVSDHYGCV